MGWFVIVECIQPCTVVGVTEAPHTLACMASFPACNYGIQFAVIWSVPQFDVYNQNSAEHESKKRHPVKRIDTLVIQASYTIEAQVLKPRMTQTRQAEMPMIDKFCHASNATYYATVTASHHQHKRRTGATSLSTRMKFSEICCQCSLIHIWAAELCWRAAMAMAKIHIKPQTQMPVWMTRTQTRFEYEATQPYNAQMTMMTKKRMQTAGNAEPCGIADGFFSMA